MKECQRSVSASSTFPPLPPQFLPSRPLHLTHLAVPACGCSQKCTELGFGSSIQPRRVTARCGRRVRGKEVWSCLEAVIATGLIRADMLGWLPALTSKLLMPKSLGLSVTLHGTIPGHKSARHPD